MCVLLAITYETHVHHARALTWLNDIETHGGPARFATCSTTELGFVRVAGNGKTRLAKNVTTAREDLIELKEQRPFIFLIDRLGADHLPNWVKRHGHVTDGHLLALATASGIPLATLDRGIPGALLIPERPNGPMMVREPTIPYGAETQFGSHLN